MKKIICYLLTILLLVMLLQPANIFTAINSDDKFVKQISVYSEAFPNAYIQSTHFVKKDFEIKERNDGKFTVEGKSTESKKIVERLYSSEKISYILDEKANNLVGVVSATAYVSETVENIDGKSIITDSHLMDKNEVLASFNSDSGMTKAVDIKTDNNTQYKLNILLVCSTVTETTKSSNYLVTGVAQWSKSIINISPSQNPASGEDFFGFAWYGGFAFKDYKGQATYNALPTTQSIKMSACKPNVGLTWSFFELMNGGDTTYDAKQIEIQTTIYKNKLDGGGNDANLCLKYIHTYQGFNGSASISFDSAGFTLSNVSKQWPLTCSITGLKY